MKECIKEKKLLSDTQKKEFISQHTKESYYYLTILSIVVFLAELIIFIIPAKLFDYSNIILYFLISSAILIPAIIIIQYKFDKIPIIIAKIVQHIYIISLLYLGIALALLSQNQADFVHMYLMAVICVSSFIMLRHIERTIIIVVGQVFFAGLLPLFQTNSNVIFVLIVNTLFFNIVAWFISYIRYNKLYKSFYTQLQLENMAHCDSMTGLFNHETILQKLMKEVSSSQMNKKPLSIIMIDVDNFKEINDNYGHIIGDSIIKQLGNMAVEVFADDGYIGRYGGDEFLIVLPGSNKNDAQEKAKQLFERVKQMKVKITLSAGISQLKEENFKEFIKKVDKRLYKAKSLGKDRVQSTE